MTYTLNLKHHFDAAHNLLNYKGVCAKMHGHRWVIEVEITTHKLINDMVVDFKKIKEIINYFDHQYLNELVSFNPTAERIAQYLFKQIKTKTKFKSKITIWESPNCSITYED